MVFPTIIRQVGDHAGIVQEEPQDLRWSTKILATCVLEDVSKYLDILTLEASVILERLSFLLGCKLILRRLTCPAQSGSLAMTYITFAAVI